jgi:hypothetical protein
MATFPKIDKFVFDQANEILAEGRKFFPISSAEGFVCPSKEAAALPDEAIKEIYNKMCERRYADWPDYVSTKKQIYIIIPSKLNPSFYICSCPIGGKKRPCKHSVYVMHHIKSTFQNPYASSLQAKRKRGRPKLANNALSMI